MFPILLARFPPTHLLSTCKQVYKYLFGQVHPDFGRIEGAARQWQRVLLLLAHSDFLTFPASFQLCSTESKQGYLDNPEMLTWKKDTFKFGSSLEQPFLSSSLCNSVLAAAQCFAFPVD